MQVSINSPPCGPVPDLSTSPGVAFSIWPHFGYQKASLSVVFYGAIHSFKNVHIHDPVGLY